MKGENAIKKAFLDPALLFIAVARGVELMRKRDLAALVASGEVNPVAMGEFFGSYVGTRDGVSYGDRFNAMVGFLSASEPAFRKWWNLMSPGERLGWRARHNLGGSRDPKRLAKVVA
jgi:hypothetical protein